MTQKQLRASPAHAPTQCSKSPFPKDRADGGGTQVYQPKRKCLCARQDSLELILSHPTQPLLASPPPSLPFLYPGHQKCWWPLVPLPWGHLQRAQKQKPLKRGHCAKPELETTGSWEWVEKDAAGRAWLHIRTSELAFPNTTTHHKN